MHVRLHVTIVVYRILVVASVPLNVACVVVTTTTNAIDVMVNVARGRTDTVIAIVITSTTVSVVINAAVRTAILKAVDTAVHTAAVHTAILKAAAPVGVDGVVINR